MSSGTHATTRAPRRLAYALVTIIAASLACDVYRVPVQVSDSLEAIVRGVEAPSTAVLFADAVHDSPTTLRPMRYVLARWLAAAAERVGTPYRVMFRGVHAVMIAAALLLFVAALRVSTWTDVAAFSGGAAVLLGHHTFAGLWREGYPVNHYAVVVVCCLAVLALATHRPRRVTPLLVAAMLAVGLLLIESAVLIWVVAVACWAVRLPGVCKQTAVFATATLVVVMIGRLGLGIGVPGIGGQGSGYVDRFYSGEELLARFGAVNPAFMAYNVISGAGSVLFSEPRVGVFRTMVAARDGKVPPALVVNVLSSFLTTVLLGWYALSRLAPTRPAPKRAAWSHTDRVAVVAVVTILMNACLVTAYIKDEILAVAGVFYAVAVFAALRGLLEAPPHRRAVVLVLTVTVCTGRQPLGGSRGGHRLSVAARHFLRADRVGRAGATIEDRPLVADRTRHDGGRALPRRSHRRAPSWLDHAAALGRSVVDVRVTPGSRALTAAAVAPLVVLAVLHAVLLGGRAGGHPLWYDPEETVPEAIATRNFGEVVRMIEAGADPNAPAPARGLFFDDGEPRVPDSARERRGRRVTGDVHPCTRLRRAAERAGCREAEVPGARLARGYQSPGRAALARRAARLCADPGQVRSAWSAACSPAQQHVERCTFCG